LPLLYVEMGCYKMDLKWPVAMLTMRVNRFIPKTRRKLYLNGKETIGFDKINVECYNCHMRGHFAREYRAPRNQGNRNRDAPGRNAPLDTSTTNALVVQNGIDGYDWTFQTSLGYDSHVNESEVLNNVVDSYESNGDDNQVNDRFKKSEGYHAVPPPYTKNYMPPRADLSFVRLDYSIFKSKVSETITSVSKIETNASKTNSEDENVFESKEVRKTVRPSLKKIKFVNARNTNVKNENKAEKPKKFSQRPMVLENKGSPMEIRPVWDNIARVNHQNKLTYPYPKRNFVPTVVLTKSGKVPVDTSKQNSQRATTSVSTTRHVNTAASRANVNSALPKTYSYFKAHSPVRRPLNKKLAAKTNNFNEKVNTAKIWRPKRNVIDHISKDSGSYTLERFNYVDPQGKLKSVMSWDDSGCSIHMTGSKSYLIDYQEIDGAFVDNQNMETNKSRSWSEPNLPNPHKSSL
nr:hypothetical protein [Tanacetum cinerariifolium]